MQYKKDAVREKILAAARKEYLAHGYRGGNISVIAEQAGVPVGNLYRYFDGKTGVLDAIVKPAYEALSVLIQRMQLVEVLDSDNLQETMPRLVFGLLDFFAAYGEDILILLDGCEGTKYEDFGEGLVAKVTDIVRYKLYGDTPTREDAAIAAAVGKAFSESLFDVLRQGLDRDEMRHVTERLIKFYFYEADMRK